MDDEEEYDNSDGDYEYTYSEDESDSDNDAIMDDINNSSNNKRNNIQNVDGYKTNTNNDDDDDDSKDGQKTPPNKTRRSSSYGNPSDFKDGESSKIGMLNSDDLKPKMKLQINRVAEVLSIPPSAAGVLLRHYKWAPERVYDAYNGDFETITKDVGIYHRCRRIFSSSLQRSTSSTSSSSNITPSTTTTTTTTTTENNNNSTKNTTKCLICLEERPTSQMFAMSCTHEFCRPCWKDYLTSIISDGPTSILKHCPYEKCNEMITEEEVKLLTNPELLHTFESYQLRSFVELNGASRWCPGPGCERIAFCDSDDRRVVATCDTCRTVFCLNCGEEPHDPLTCEEFTRWCQKCRNESETANWILANTKACPHCSSRIEKNQGCNHMTCQKCKYEFCWICMGNWDKHGSNTGGYYSCNKFKDENNDQTDVAKAKKELDRYLHYYKRFHAHNEAQKFAFKQLKETENRMALLQESSDNSTYIDVQFLKVANEQLVECRRVLKYTYAYAYYMNDVSEGKSGRAGSNSSNQNKEVTAQKKMQFEYHQEMLERFTETLSDFVEKPLLEIEKTNVVNMTRVVKTFMKNIIQYVEDGMEG